MANAYDVMSMAKRQGAEVKAVEEYDKYMKRLQAEEARASKAGMLGKIGGGIGGSIASFLAPAAVAALGIGTGGIGSMLLAGALGTGVSRAGTEAGDFLARQWTMGGKGRGKDFKDIGKMKGISGPYGRRRASELQRAGRQSMEDTRKSITEMLDVENTNRWLSSAMSGLGTAGKVRHGAEGLKEGATLGDRMKAALQGQSGEGYKLGAKSTGDFWQQKAFDVGNLKNVKGNKALMDLITTTEGVAPDTTDMNVEMYKQLFDPAPVGADYTEIGGFSPLSIADTPAQAITTAPASYPQAQEMFFPELNLPTMSDRYSRDGLYGQQQSIFDILQLYTEPTRRLPIRR